MKLWQITSLCGAFLVAGVLLGQYINVPNIPFTAGSPDATQPDAGHPLINPLLFCKDQGVSNYTNAVTNQMSQQLNAYLSVAQSKGTVAQASVYYKDLNDGPWVSINGSMQTVPASLLKVPTALAIYKHAEAEPSFLAKVFMLDASNTVNQTQYFMPPKMIGPGKKYTTEDLLGYMLEDSDNAALDLLGTSLTNQQFVDSYTDLGISAPTQVAPGYTINAITFASFFRVLFNSSYLTQDDSEHMLELLSQSDFAKGIRAGVPPATVVADKFGEYSVSDTDLALNDCGIVYRPGDPYILCVLTRGTNYDSLAQVIADISSTVWSVLQNQ